MSRRTASLVVSGLLVVLLTAAAALLPVPYVALEPGPTTNTLGSSGGMPLIEVDGRRTYPAQGRLDLTTVAVFGGPGSPIDLFTALRGWLDERVAVVPEETVFSPGQTEQEAERETAAQMSASQRDATAAALTELGIPVRRTVEVGPLTGDSSAKGVLETGDRVVAVDGKQVRAPADVRRLIGARDPGDDVSLTIVRQGRRRTVTVATKEDAAGRGRAVVGFFPSTGYEFPFTVKIRLKEVGGPSAGLMFALGIVEKLTPEDLTDGAHIAGTGTIDGDGKVGPIGGIQQKVVAAREAGARVFLTPAGNCADAVAVKPDGLRLVRVTDLEAAIDALDALKTGRGSVPSCRG